MTGSDWLGGTVRHYCPLCAWHLDVPVHHDMAVTGQMVRDHFAVEHGLADAGTITSRASGGPPQHAAQEPGALDSRLTHFQIELPASAGAPRPETPIGGPAAAEAREERV
ncbi:hypothetical protein XF35_39955, partial [Streptomyces platensis subsp. clarensis]|nr:hypothetical protein [Streptomyces platensis subsp. clarensis]